MKRLRTTTTWRLPLALALTWSFTAPASLAVDPDAPIGRLDAQRNFVRTGSKVRLEWEITYPTKIDDLLRIDPAGGFTTNQDLDVTIHAIGMEFVSWSHDNGHGNNADGVDVTNPGKGRGGPNGRDDVSEPLDDELQTNGNLKERRLDLDANLWIAENGNWQEVFAGGASELTGDAVYSAAALPMGTSVDLAAQGKSNRGSFDVVSTTSASPNLIVLKDGDSLPDNVSAFRNDTIANFLTPYVSDRKINLGPHQMIVLFDLDSTPGSKAFSLQDLGLLVSVKPNEKRTVHTPPSAPELSQSNRRRGERNRPDTRRNDKDRGAEPNGGNQAAGSDKTPAGTPKTAAGSEGHAGNAPKSTPKSSPRTNSSRTKADRDGLDDQGSRHAALFLDLELLAEKSGMTIEELKTLLAVRPGESREAYLVRIKALRLLIDEKFLREQDLRAQPDEFEGGGDPERID